MFNDNNREENADNVTDGECNDDSGGVANDNCDDDGAGNSGRFPSVSAERMVT